MARLIINNDTIHFIEEGKSLTGRLSRLFINNEIIFIVKYLQPGQDNHEIKRVKRIFCEKASCFHWVNHPVNETDNFSRIIGGEIEKCPHLLVHT
jgi:hypothetical protein